MAKTCGFCEKSTVEDVKVKNNKAEGLCRCSVTGQIHEDHHPCDVPEKPRLCEVLGVAVGERFRVHSEFGDDPIEFYIDDKGYLCEAGKGSKNIGIYWLTQAINHPGMIERVPRLTPEEVQRCRAFGAKWVSRDKSGDLVCLWAPGQAGDGRSGGRDLIAWIQGRFFPSVQPGQWAQVVDEP